MSVNHDMKQSKPSTSRSLDNTELIKYRIKEKIHQKKLAKIQTLSLKNGAKKYKKFLLMKRFEEDEMVSPT